MIRIILLVFMPLRWLIIRMGADFNQFIIILKLKLTLDNRIKNISGKAGNALFNRSLTNIIIGLLLALLLYNIRSPFSYYYFAHVFLMVMMAMLIISELSTIIFDTSENAIIHPLPVSGNTLSLARNAHVFIYLTLVAFSLSAIIIVIAFKKFGIVSGIAFMISIFLNIILTLFISNIIYLIIIRMASGEKLKNLLMYFQIAVAILLMVGYQLVMKIFDLRILENLTIPIHWYTFFIPPAFFSALADALTTFNIDLTHLVLITEALIIPILALYFTGRYLTPEFNNKLIDLEQGDKSSRVIREIPGGKICYKVMCFLFMKKPDERASFKLTWHMIGRERFFKQILYPSFGYTLVIIVLPVFGSDGGMQSLARSERYLLFLYSLSIVAVSLPMALISGQNKQAAWIFKSIPMHSPADLFKGCIKAAFARYFIPLYIVVSIGVCSIWGLDVIPDVIISFIFIYFLTLFFYYTQRPSFPFLLEKSVLNSGTGSIKAILTLILIVAFGFMHQFMLHLHPLANLLLIPIVAGAILYLDRIAIYRIITWKKADRINTY